MWLFKKIWDWISDKFYENVKEIKENFEEILENFGNIFLAVILMAVGFYIIKDYSWFSLLFYILTAIWIVFFNTPVLVKKPLYFYITLVILLVAGAIKPILIDSFNFLRSGDILMFCVYLGVWIAIRIRFNQLRNE